MVWRDFQRVLNGKTPENLQEQETSLVGTDIYEKLIKDYTEKDRTLSLLWYAPGNWSSLAVCKKWVRLNKQDWLPIAVQKYDW